ncbi:MAG TPA: hypothetical protein ENK63_04515 [Rhodobacterales bacterium]|nr:hypothetical protein [Rhodobacterales bacterium]
MPNAWLVLEGERGFIAASENQIVVAGAASLTLAGFGVWVVTLWRGALGRFWLEPLVLVGSAAYLTLSTNNWTAH